MNRELPGIPGREYESYSGSQGATLRLYRGVSQTEFLALVAELKASGFVAVQSHSLEENHFVTLTDEDSLVQVNYFPRDKTLRVTLDPNKHLPLLEPDNALSRTARTTLWQFETDHSLIDCGMCYIVRCCDGSFFIIDSAHTYSVNDGQRIHDFLRRNTPEKEKIVISGWFFSHGHVDHIGQFMNFLQFYSEDTEIECLYCNFIPNSHRDNGNWSCSDLSFVRKFYELVPQYPRLAVCHLHAGERFYVRNLQFDTLMSHEEVFPESNENYNDSSVVLMMEAEGTKVLFPGDAGAKESDFLEKHYRDFLHAPILQAAHHGHFGCSAQFYRLVNAEVVLFPTTQIKFDEEYEKIEANRVACSLAKQVYISSNGTTEISLPYREGTIRTLPDETFEDFEGIYHLWGYTYTPERRKALYEAYLARGGAPLGRYEKL